MLILVVLILILVYVFNKRETKKSKIEKSCHKTRVEDYLWLIRLLKSNGFDFKEKTGLNTPHIILSFENPQGIVVKIEQDYTLLDDNQGKLFLVSGNNKMQTYFFHNETRQKEIESWLTTLK